MSNATCHTFECVMAHGTRGKHHSQAHTTTYKHMNQYIWREINSTWDGGMSSWPTSSSALHRSPMPPTRAHHSPLRFTSPTQMNSVKKKDLDKEQEEEERGWMPYYLTPRTHLAFVHNGRKMKKVFVFDDKGVCMCVCVCVCVCVCARVCV